MYNRKRFGFYAICFEYATHKINKKEKKNGRRKEKNLADLNIKWQRFENCGENYEIELINFQIRSCVLKIYAFHNLNMDLFILSKCFVSNFSSDF